MRTYHISKSIHGKIFNFKVDINESKEIKTLTIIVTNTDSQTFVKYFEDLQDIGKLLKEIAWEEARKINPAYQIIFSPSEAITDSKIWLYAQFILT